MAKDLKLNLIASAGSGTEQAFKKVRKGLKDLAAHSQAAAVALAKLNMKDAANSMAHLSQSLSGVNKAFEKGEKGVADYSRSLDKNEQKMSKYQKALTTTTSSIGNHTKSIKALGKIYGTADDKAESWLRVLNKVEAAGISLSQQYRGQIETFGKSRRAVDTYARSLSTAEIAQQVLNKNISITNGQFKILNREGLTGFRNLSEETARSLGMLDKSFGRINASAADTKAWEKAKRNFSGTSKAVQELNARIKENPEYTARATKILERYNSILNSGKARVAAYKKAWDTAKVGFLGAAKDLKKLNDRVKENPAYATRAIEVLNRYNSKLASHRKYVDRTAIAWDKAKSKFNGAATSIKRLDALVKKSPANLERAIAVLNRYNSKLAASERNTSKLGKGLSYLGAKFKSFAAYTLAAATTAATLSTAFKALTVNIQYSQALKDLEAITRATSDEMERMDKTIRHVAGTTKFSAGEIAAGMKMLGQSGFSATESIEAIEAISNLATGTLSSMATAVEITTTALRVFHIDASKAAEVTDIFTNAVNNSKLTIDKIKTAMNYLGPIAESAGMSLKDTTSSLMVLSNAGIRASSMATGLRRVLKELVSPSEKMSTAFREAGYSADDFNPKMNDMRTIISRLKNIVGDTDDAFRLFGLRGATTATALVTQGLPAFDKMSKAVNKQGTAAENADIQLEGLGIKFKQIKDKAANLGLALGDAGLTSILGMFADAVRGTLDGMTAIVSSPVVSWVIKLTGAIGSLLALEFAASVLSSTKAVSMFGSALSAATLKARIFQESLLTNPYILAAAAVIALALAYKELHKTTAQALAEKKKEREEASKTSDSLLEEIEKTKKFNGTAEEKVKLLDKLAKTYPEYAAEIYSTTGGVEDLVATLEKLQKLEEAKRLRAARAELKLYAKDIKKLGNTVETAEKKVDDFINVSQDAENLAALNQAEQKFNTIVASIVSNMIELNDAGQYVTVEDFLPVDEFGEVLDGYKKYVTQIEAAITAREKFKNSGGATKETITSKIDSEKDNIKKLKQEARLAEISKIRIGNELSAAQEGLTLLKETTNSELDLFYSKKKVNDLQERYNGASEEALRKGKKVNEAERKLIELRKEESKVALKMAKFDGSNLDIAIAKENKAYYDRLQLAVNLSRERSDLGWDEVDNVRLFAEKKEEIDKKHQYNLKKINADAGKEAISLAQRVEEAKKDISYATEEELRKSIIARLENDKKVNAKLLKQDQARLDELTSMEGNHSDEVAALVSKIEEHKKSILSDEKKLIKKRTALVVDQYNVEIKKIKEVTDVALQELENRNSRGLLSAERYERAKGDIESEALALRFNAARAQLEEMDRIGTVSEKERADAVIELNAIKEEFYQKEVTRAEENRARHKAQIEQEKKDMEDRASAEKKRQDGIASAASFISGIYTQAANAAAEIGAKTASIIGKGNVFFETAATNTKNAASELARWGAKLDWATTMVASFEKASQTAMGGWRIMYMDLEKKWKEVVAATKEKVQLTRDLGRIEKTEINDLTNISAIQGKLNSLRTKYKYLGEDDLQNLLSAKRALQEQINQQRLLNAEKETGKADSISAKLEEAKAAGIDIDNYGFDKASADRLAALEKENLVLDAKIAKQEYLDALAMQALEERGASEEEITAAKEEAEARIAEMKAPEKLINLEMAALSSKLNVEQLNLKIINDLKIKQYEEELAREEELHQKRLEDIEIENKAKMQAVQYEEDKAIPNGSLTSSSSSTSITGFATGGRIPGESTIDSVPVLARPGEWFIRNESAQHWTKNFGAGFMDGINKPLSAAGRGISSALSKVGNVAFPEVVQAPKVAFASGGQVKKYKEEDSSITSQLGRLASAIENQNRSAKSGEESPGKTITVNIKSEKTQATGEFSEKGAQQLFKLLQEQRMVTG